MIQTLKNSFTLIQSLLVIAIIALLAASALPAWADTPLTYPTGAPNFMTPDTNGFPLLLAANTTTNFPANGTNSLEKYVRQDHGLSVFVTVISTNAGGTTETLGWDVTGDGTVYTANHPLTFAVPANFVGTNTYWTNWPATVLSNVRQIQLTTATNALVGGGPTTNSATYYLRYSYSNQ